MLDLRLDREHCSVFAELYYVTDAILLPTDNAYFKQTVSMRHHILQAISVLVVR